MPRAVKVAAWTVVTIVVAVVVTGLAAYASLECMETEPCPTGGWLPYGQFAAVGALLIGVGYVWLVVGRWLRR